MRARCQSRFLHSIAYRVTAEPETPAISDRHVARGLGTTLLSRLGAVVEVIAQPLYVAMFGLAGYGLYAVLWAVITLAQNVLDLGMTAALQRVVPQARDESEELAALKSALLAGLTPCLIAAAIISLFAPSIVGWFNVAPENAADLLPAIRLFAFALPIWAFVEIATSALRAKQLFGAEIRLRIFWEQLIRLGVATLLFAAGWGVLGLVIAHLVSLVITAGLCIRLLARHYPLRRIIAVPVRPIFAQTLGAGLSTLPANLSARLFSDAPPLILNAILPGASGASTAALFVIIRKVSSLVQLIRMAFAYVLAPIASLAAKHDTDHVNALYGFATRVSASIALPLALTMAGASAPMMAAFGVDYSWPAVLGLLVMLVARGFEASLGAGLPVLQVVGRYRDQYWATAIGLIVAVGMGVWLVPANPLVGMVQTVATALVITALVPVVQLRLLNLAALPLSSYWRGLKTGIGLGAMGFFASAALAEVVPWQAGIAAMVVFALPLMWLGLRSLPLADRQALGSVGRRLRLTFT